MTKRILLGRISAAHGIRGDVLVKSFAAAPEDIASYGPLTDAAGSRSFRLSTVRSTAKGVICRIDGITDRNAAEGLRGTELWVDRDRLPPPGPGEYYHVDLIGLSAFDPDGRRIGKVAAIQNYGATDILEIARDDGSGSELVPLTDAFVPSIDVEAGRLVVIPPAYSSDEPT